MTPSMLWAAAGLPDLPYDAWSFGDDADALAELVLCGVKTATCSALPFYTMENEPLPKIGAYSVVLDAKGEAVCIIRTTRVTVIPFCRVSEAHAKREGEGDRTLAHWRTVHERFFREELQGTAIPFTPSLPLVLEEFELVYPLPADSRRKKL